VTRPFHYPARFFDFVLFIIFTGTIPSPMKKAWSYTSILIFLCTVLAGCTKENSSDIQLFRILTGERKAALEAAADSVFMDVNTPGMIALVSVEGEGDYIIKRGVSSLVTGEPMNENSYFRIASNTKTFTGTAVLVLADEGKISLDSVISHYLPEYAIPNGDSITVRMLGNMTSGLYNYSDDPTMWTSFYESNFSKSFPPDTLLAIAFRHPVKFSPGAMYDYCNTNTVLLGLLLEKVTGKPAARVIREKVIEPVGLKHTYWPNSVFLFSPYIHGYNAGYDKLMEATNWDPSWGYTAGALISTIPDMKIWAKALAGGQLLSASMKSERFTWVQDHYGFCVMKAGNWVGHPGSIFGYNSHVFYNSSLKTTLIILVNMDTGTPVEYFSNAFRKILDR
jgi:D-alanyl-D-alanine carboxypeptidase